MASIMIVYASLTGNTEDIAERIAEGVRESGCEAVLREVDSCSASDLVQHDGLLLGAYTWGDGELPDEFLDFAEEWDEIELEGVKCAVFGSGDTGYAVYCGAVDIIEAKLREKGAELVQESLKIEYGPNAEEKEGCRDYGRRFARRCMAAVS
ncbi:flavodoxin [Paenibacillus spiritus]|uniref:Flavodoxin n=1 Tax=Paenibacillus spiritus TaxID=2496557 RepID=A0A5J5GDS2_9BACL|nr:MULTISPECIES: flavodoxin [Paenibacillus]KAA9006315.1 flavodoxin [Paenibacillus spiritus]